MGTEQVYTHSTYWFFKYLAHVSSPNISLYYMMTRMMKTLVESILIIKAEDIYLRLLVFKRRGERTICTIS